MVQNLSGIEQDAQALITERRAIIHPFLAIHGALQQSASDNESFESPATLAGIAILESRASRPRTDARDEAIHELRQSLHQVAADLGLYRAAEELTWQECWRARHFDRLHEPAHRIDKVVPGARQPEQPQTRHLIRTVRQLLDEVKMDHDDPKQRAEREKRFILELVRRQLCRNRGNAHAVFAIIRGSKSKDKRNAIRKAAQLRLFAHLPKPARNVLATKGTKPVKRRKRQYIPHHPKWDKLCTRLRLVRASDPHVFLSPSLLVETEIAPTPQAAEEVVVALDRSVEQSRINCNARNLLFSLLRAYGQQGDVALLLHSRYPLAHIVIEVEQRIRRRANNDQHLLPVAC